MKGKIIVKDEKWYVEILSDLHGYGIGWGDSKIYPLLITDENIWAGKDVEVEPVHYDSNFIPVIVKIKDISIVDTWNKEKISIFEEARTLTHLELEEINEGKWPFYQYYKGKLELDENFDYYLIPSTGSFIVKVEKDK